MKPGLEEKFAGLPSFSIPPQFSLTSSACDLNFISAPVVDSWVSALPVLAVSFAVSQQVLCRSIPFPVNLFCKHASLLRTCQRCFSLLLLLPLSLSRSSQDSKRSSQAIPV